MILTHIRCLFITTFSYAHYKNCCCLLIINCQKISPLVILSINLSNPNPSPKIKSFRKKKLGAILINKQGASGLVMKNVFIPKLNNSGSVEEYRDRAAFVVKMFTTRTRSWIKLCLRQPSEEKTTDRLFFYLLPFCYLFIFFFDKLQLAGILSFWHTFFSLCLGYIRESPIPARAK